MSTVLNEYGVTELLITLLENPELYQGELEKQVSVSRYKVINLLDRLIDAGLIQEERGKYARKYLKLTGKGVEVAQALRKAREALKE